MRRGKPQRSRPDPLPELAAQPEQHDGDRRLRCERKASSSDETGPTPLVSRLPKARQSPGRSRDKRDTPPKPVHQQTVSSHHPNLAPALRAEGKARRIRTNQRTVTSVPRGGSLVAPPRLATGWLIGRQSGRCRPFTRRNKPRTPNGHARSGVRSPMSTGQSCWHGSVVSTRW
jgi:hypothetical protein